VEEEGGEVKKKKREWRKMGREVRGACIADGVSETLDGCSLSLQNLFLFLAPSFPYLFARVSLSPKTA
jgi:hypothetical protein